MEIACNAGVSIAELEQKHISDSGEKTPLTKMKLGAMGIKPPLRKYILRRFAAEFLGESAYGTGNAPSTLPP